MILRPAGITLTFLLMIFTSCKNGGGSGDHGSNLHSSSLMDQSIQMERMLDEQINMCYGQVDMLLLNDESIKPQYDSIMRFKQNINEYQNFLWAVRARLISRAQNVPEIEADTTDYLLVSNANKVVSLDPTDIEKLKQMTDSLKIWFCDLPYTEDDEYRGPDMVWDYGHSGEFFEWTAVGFEDKTVSQQLLTIRSLLLHSRVVEVFGVSSFVIGANRVKSYQ